MKNVEEYLINPKSPEFKPPEPDPKAAAETALLQAKVAELQNSMQVLTEKTKFEIEMQGMKHDLDKKQAMIDMLMDQREQERKEYETKTRAAVAEREIIIMEQSEPTKVSQSNIVSPNS
jgi:hypothetical protein